MNANPVCIMRAAAAALSAWLLWPGSLLGSSASALREYKDGKYDQALKDYQQMLERKGDDARLHFNAGAAAYRDKQLDEAAKQFDEAANASDLKLQGMAYYNRGNTLYYLGDQNPEPSKREDAWKKSIQDFQNSLKLNPQDPDAKYNLAFVKKKLEELKQQQQQSQNNQQKDQDQKPDQKPGQNQDRQNQKQDQQKQDQQKQEQQQQQGQQNQPQDQPQQKQPEQSQQDQQKQGDQKQPQPAGQSQDQKQQPKGAAGQPEGSDQKDQEQQAEAVPAGQMTPEQARQLLDAQKGDEMVLPANPKAKPADVRRPFKDW